MDTLTSTKDLSALVKTLSKKPFITIDTEFLREKTYYPKLCLIQISDPEKNAVAIDPLADGMDLSPLYDLLENPKVLKVFHAGRQDLEIFYNLTGKVVSPFFDTQIAAMVCGFGDSVGYENLVRTITGQSIDKSAQFTDWSHRPLSERQIKYALGDVTHLCDIYLHLAEALDARGRRGWVMQEEEVLADPKTYENDPYGAWRRVKIRSPKPQSLAVLREIAAWREEQAQERNIPKNWAMRDETLADMAAQAPKSVEALKKIRGVSADMANGRTGKILLERIKTALSSPREDWPKPERKEALPPQLQACADILKMLLKVQSAEHEVAPKLIASQDDLEKIALSDAADVPALKGWRREIFGQDALDLKNGKLAIGLKGDKIMKYRVQDLP
ncbi:MAG: ribonuclease D [Alphaproteobacteria bacterium]|nr:ribonuclease D [Alphaproteobacteria bacterium]